MSATVDVNVLVYASNKADPAHGPARTLVERLAAGPDLVYLFCPILLGYVRIVTHPAILPRPLALAAALANVASLLSLAHVRAPGEADGFLLPTRQPRTSRHGAMLCPTPIWPR